jgi:tripartite-type tricarboxylate transporter receptor subunit TctC
VQSSTPAELKDYIGKELKRWERVIHDNGIKVSL